VNPGGVKRDYAIYGDGEQEDEAWDAACGKSARRWTRLGLDGGVPYSAVPAALSPRPHEYVRVSASGAISIGVAESA